VRLFASVKGTKRREGPGGLSTFQEKQALIRAQIRHVGVPGARAGVARSTRNCKREIKKGGRRKQKKGKKGRSHSEEKQIQSGHYQKKKPRVAVQMRRTEGLVKNDFFRREIAAEKRPQETDA